MDSTHTRDPSATTDAEAAIGGAAEAAAATVRGRRERGRYDILGEHGRGGLGRVSRARDRELGRDIAIKELISRGHLHEVRFLREALITARLEHPGIVPVYEAGRWSDGTPFYAMKLVSGRPLRDLIAERKTVDERLSLLHHVIAVADAIAYAHGKNVIHRDLKPANIIVGDFGETVVIDWGLAKDLTTDEPSVGDGPFRVHRDDGLTSAGTILGTRAYMAPEQERGERVDQRADVFAIGAMLWELCALLKLPASLSGERGRILRIDPDLAAIIEKALHADPAHRYPDAGALAADLKAFKAGARIAARRYTLWGLIAHWARRHRALAVVIPLGLATAAVSAALYVRNIAAERDRADTSEDHARRALDELTLKHAELLLTTDPSATVDVLAGYRGSNAERAGQIRAEAIGRGVAALRATPHTAAAWAEATPRGELVSWSADGTIALTSRTGASTVAAHGVAGMAGIGQAYSRARHLLAYACAPADLCLYDAARGTRLPVLRAADAAAVALSTRGTLVAWMSRDSVVHVVDITDPARPVPRLSRPVIGGTDVRFMDDDTVVAHVTTGLEFIHLDGSSESAAVTGNSYWEASPEQDRFATTTRSGQALVFEGRPPQLAARAELCRGPASGIQFLAGRHALAYACKNGAVGLWDPDAGTVTPRIQLEGHADVLAVSSSGEYVIAGGGNGTVDVLDLVTDLVTVYRGHKGRLISLSPPTRESPFLVSADVTGAVRAWPLPPRLAKVIASLPSPMHTAIFNERSEVAATSFQPVLTTYSPSRGVGSVGPHDVYHVFLEPSRSGQAFAAYGFNDHFELWSAQSLAQTAAIQTQQGALSQVSFAGATDDAIAAGHDGRLIRWTPAGEPTVLGRIDRPIAAFAQAAGDDAIVFAGDDGALWRTAPGGRVLPVRGSGSRVTRLIALPDQPTVYAGTASGDLIAIDTRSWQLSTVLHGDGGVREIATTADGRIIAVATLDGTLHVGAIGRDPASGVTWSRSAISAVHLTLAPDGLLVALAANGSIWIHSATRGNWICLPVGTADIRWVSITRTGTAAVVLDAEGRMIWIDLDAARRQLEIAS